MDDQEIHPCRVVLDEVLGSENFMGTVIWQNADGPRNDLPNFCADHDFILVYRKSPAPKLGAERLPQPEVGLHG